MNKTENKKNIMNTVFHLSASKTRQNMPTGCGFIAIPRQLINVISVKVINSPEIKREGGAVMTWNLFMTSLDKR